jgi:hypothetical protein
MVISQVGSRLDGRGYFPLVHVSRKQRKNRSEKGQEKASRIILHKKDGKNVS